MGKPRKPDVEITDTMIKASDAFLADLEDARMVRHINLMGGTQGNSSWTRKVKKTPNRDLVIAVVTYKMKQAIATFIAISRAQKSHPGAAKPNPGGDVEVTEAMNETGRQIMNDLTEASVCRFADGMGGARPWSAWLRTKPKNRDLILRYIKKKIDAVTAAYIAMSRQRDAENTQKPKKG
jgi:hypothetical protein